MIYLMPAQSWLGRSGRSSPSMDLFDDVGDPGSDGVYEDVTGSNLACP